MRFGRSPLLSTLLDLKQWRFDLLRLRDRLLAEATDHFRFGRSPLLSTLLDDKMRHFHPLRLRDRLLAEATDHFARGHVEQGAASLARLNLATVDEETLKATDPFLRAIADNRKIVASTDPTRVPAEDEVVIVYGYFPHSFDNVVVNNPIRRHVSSFGELPYDVVESDPCWNGISHIIIINADHRLDRYDAVMRELALAKAPFDRVIRLSAVFESATMDPYVNGTIGCLKSHLAALRLANPGPGEHVLILEDDFCFTSDLGTHLNDLASFIERRYDYVVCLLATSKYGRIDPLDDLVSESRQPCTNTCAYLVSGDNYDQLIAVHEEALVGLLATHNLKRYAADRYWKVLQSEGRFLVFRRKMGFQVASFSDIEHRASRDFD